MNGSSLLTVSPGNYSALSFLARCIRPSGFITSNMRMVRVPREASAPSIFSQTISARNGIVSHIEYHTSEPEIAGRTGPPLASEANPLPPSDRDSPAIPPPSPVDDDVNLRAGIWSFSEPAPLDTVGL